MERKSKAVLIGALVVLALALLALVGEDEADESQRIYCENVRAGVWPDYEGTYQAECGGEKPPKFNENLIDN